MRSSRYKSRPSFDRARFVGKCVLRTIARTTPPSTRTAAPLVAEAKGLARNRPGAPLRGPSEALQERGRAQVPEELPSHLGGVLALLAREALDENCPPFGNGWTGGPRWDRHACPHGQLGEAAGERELRRLVTP